MFITDKSSLLVLVFALALSPLLLIYIFRRLILEGIENIFDKFVKRTELSQGTHRDRATFYVFLQAISIVAIPLLVWYLFENLFLIFIGLVLAFKAPGILYRIRIERRKKKIEQELPVTLAMFASALSSGVSLASAISTYVTQTKSPLSTELAYLIRLQRLGVDFDDALEQVSKRVALADFDLVVLSMRISKMVGGNLSETLLSLGNSIQQKLLIEGKIKALTSQGVMQAWVMSMLPVMVAAALTFIQPDQMDKLYHTLPGNLVLVGCAIMDYIGFKIIKKILSIDV